MKKNPNKDRCALITSVHGTLSTTCKIPQGYKPDEKDNS
jgi:hypothetical protein